MKKGAYDLGRKAMYYIVVMIIIAVLFTYMSGNFRKYQITKLSNLDKVTDLVMVNNVIKCVSKKDADTGRIYLYTIDEKKLNKESLVKCLGKDKPYADKAIKLQFMDKEIETETPYFEYNSYTKIVQYKGEKKELKISIEKYPQLTK